jgi:hypothetical protein
MLTLMPDESGRWVRIPERLRDELAEAAVGVRHPALLAVLDLYERARPEDWIAQLVEVNRELADELQKMQVSAVSAGVARRSA